nr:MAG TPA: hypothetical protein [Caudoviricetes sp.]
MRQERLIQELSFNEKIVSQCDTKNGREKWQKQG